MGEITFGRGASKKGSVLVGDAVSGGKILAQVNLTGTTAASIYSPVAGKVGVVKQIMISNNSSSANSTVIFYHDADGTTYDDTTTIFGEAINKSVFSLFSKLGFALVQSGGNFAAKLTATGNVTVTLFGEELDDNEYLTHKQLAQVRVTLAATDTQIYSPPANTEAIIDTIVIYRLTGASSPGVTAYLSKSGGATGDGNTIIPNVSLPSGNYIVLSNLDWSLSNVSGYLKAKYPNANEVVVTVYGREQS